MSNRLDIITNTKLYCLIEYFNDDTNDFFCNLCINNMYEIVEVMQKGVCVKYATNKNVDRAFSFNGISDCVFNSYNVVLKQQLALFLRGER